MCVRCAEAAMLSPVEDYLLHDAQLPSGDASANRNPFQRAAGLHRMSYHRHRLSGIVWRGLQDSTESGGDLHPNSPPQAKLCSLCQLGAKADVQPQRCK